MELITFAKRAAWVATGMLSLEVYVCAFVIQPSTLMFAMMITPLNIWAWAVSIAVIKDN